MAEQKTKTVKMTHKDGKPRKVLRSERLTQNGKRFNLTKLAARKRLKAKLMTRR